MANHFDPKRLRLTAITNRHLCADLLQTTAALIEGGVTAIMLREKDLSPRDLLSLALPLRELCRTRGALFLVNGSVEVAIAADADGVHLGGEALPLKEARKVGGPNLIYGVSIHQRSELKPAVEDGADYACISPIYPPNSKKSAAPPLGLEQLAEITAESPIPLLALGGITPDRAEACLEAGAAGIAAVGALYGASDPKAAASSFKARMP